MYKSKHTFSTRTNEGVSQKYN